MRAIFIGGTGFVIMAIAAFSFTPLGDNFASVIGANDIITTTCLAQISAQLTGDIVRDYKTEKADLNDDGDEDRIIKFTDESSCGTNGCIHEICLAKGSNVTRISFGYAATNLTILSSKTNNMYDLRLNNNITLSWDEERYVLAE